MTIAFINKVKASRSGGTTPRSKESRGMTLLEVMIATAILVVLVLLAMTAFVDTTKAVTGQDSILRMDNQANKSLREIAEAMKSAILPVYVDKSSTVRNNPDDTFYDIDHRDHGFSGSVGKSWRQNLRSGMDAIAFVVPIDAQRVGDYLDDANHIQIGQIRGDLAYLSATPSGTPNSGNDFTIRQSGELVNVLAAMDPGRLTALSFETIANPTPAQWMANTKASGVAWPSVTSFIAIRFVPALQSDGSTPIELGEQNVFGKDVDIDFDGNGSFNDKYHVGRLQMVYSGGSPFYRVSGNSVVTETVNQIVHDLTPNTVLRKVNPSDRTPIFRLVDFDYANIADSGDDAGMIEETSGGGKMALSVRLLLLDNDGITATGRVITKAYLQSLQSRWYETTIVLKNMER